jgi:hypothetical protein
VPFLIESADDLRLRIRTLEWRASLIRARTDHASVQTAADTAVTSLQMAARRLGPTPSRATVATVTVLVDDVSRFVAEMTDDDARALRTGHESFAGSLDASE